MGGGGHRLVGRPLGWLERGEVALDGGPVAAGDGTGERGGGAERGDVVDGGAHEVEERLERDARGRRPPARPGRAARRGGSTRCTRRRGRRPGRRRPPCRRWPPRSPTTLRGERVAGDREPGAVAQAAGAGVGVGQRRPADGSRPAGGGAPSTSRPSEPARWATTVPATGSIAAATSAMAASGVAITSRSTSRAPAPTEIVGPTQRRKHPPTRCRPMLEPATSRPARGRSPEVRGWWCLCWLCVWLHGVTFRPPYGVPFVATAYLHAPPNLPLGPPSRRPTSSGARSARGAITKRRSCMRGWGTTRSGSSTSRSPTSRMSTSSVRGPHRSPRTRSAAASKRAAQVEQLARCLVGVQLDDDVEVVLLARRPTHGLGLVHRRHRDDLVAERLDRVAQEARASRRGSSPARGTRRMSGPA